MTKFVLGSDVLLAFFREETGADDVENLLMSYSFFKKVISRKINLSGLSLTCA